MRPFRGHPRLVHRGGRVTAARRSQTVRASGSGHAGVAASSLPLPRSSSLIGTELFHQMLVIEFGTGGSLQRLAGTNGLLLRLGAL